MGELLSDSCHLQDGQTSVCRSHEEGKARGSLQTCSKSPFGGV